MSVVAVVYGGILQYSKHDGFIFKIQISWMVNCFPYFTDEQIEEVQRD